MIDSLHYGLDKIKNLPNAKDDDYGLITLHRPSNVDDYSNLKNIIIILKAFQMKLNCTFQFIQEQKNKFKIII